MYPGYIIIRRVSVSPAPCIMFPSGVWQWCREDACFSPPWSRRQWPDNGWVCFLLPLSHTPDFTLRSHSVALKSAAIQVYLKRLERRALRKRYVLYTTPTVVLLPCAYVQGIKWSILFVSICHCVCHQHEIVRSQYIAQCILSKLVKTFLCS
jgi:hypothetical protein